MVVSEQLGKVTFEGVSFFFRPDSTDLRIIDMVYMRNGYDMPLLMDNMNVIDIGANIGAFTVLCAERGARVYAYEPEPTNYQMLIKNRSRRRTDKEAAIWSTIVCCEAGLGPYNGSARLYIHDGNSGGHSITEKVGERSVPISVMTLHGIMGDFNDVDVLKLDCEGAEIYAIPAILDGLHNRIRTIVMEIHNEIFDEKVAMIQSLEQFYTAENLFQADWKFTHK